MTYKLLMIQQLIIFALYSLFSVGIIADRSGSSNARSTWPTKALPLDRARANLKLILLDTWDKDYDYYYYRECMTDRDACSRATGARKMARS